MPVKHHIDNINTLIITDWVGDADVDRFISAYLKYQKKVRNNQELLGYDEIVNFSKAKKLNFKLRNLKHFVNVAVSYDSKINTKLAFIVDSKVAYVLAKGYGVLRRLNPDNRKMINVFFNEFDALKWINNKN